MALTSPTCALADCSRRAHGAAPVATQVRYSSLAREWPPRTRRGCARTPTTPRCVPSPPPHSRVLAVAQGKCTPSTSTRRRAALDFGRALENVCIALRGPRRAVVRIFCYKHSASTALHSPCTGRTRWLGTRTRSRAAAAAQVQCRYRRARPCKGTSRGGVRAKASAGRARARP